MLCASAGGRGDPAGTVQGWAAIRTYCEQSILRVSVEPGIRGEDSGPLSANLQLAPPPHAAQLVPAP